MKHEMIDEYNARKEKIGIVDKAVAHEKGLWHIHVGVWIMNKKGELLFQQRSMQKKINPGKWTRTGGHVDSGETPLQAVQRETYEEMVLSAGRALSASPERLRQWRG